MDTPHTDHRHARGVSPLTSKGKEAPPLLGGTQVEADIVIARVPERCYDYWRAFVRWPEWARHIDSVAEKDARTSHWTLRGPADTTVEWDAELLADIPGDRISWRTLEGSQVSHAGSVHFMPVSGGQSTQVKVMMTYNPPVGPLGDWVARLLGASPERELAAFLKSFKAALENPAAF